MSCVFIRAWIGPCGKPGNPYCYEHEGVMCGSCGQKATGECDATGQFVCGYPLCPDCQHVGDGNRMQHARKNDTALITKVRARQEMDRLSREMKWAERSLEKAREAYELAVAKVNEAARLMPDDENVAER